MASKDDCVCLLSPHGLRGTVGHTLRQLSNTVSSKSKTTNRLQLTRCEYLKQIEMEAEFGVPCVGEEISARDCSEKCNFYAKVL